MVSIIKRHFDYTLCFVRIVFNALFFTVDDCSVKSGVVLRMVNVCIFFTDKCLFYRGCSNFKSCINTEIRCKLSENLVV